ncbi:MAG: metal-sulfur cluster assembly factor [Ignavibacteriaceae bacterium]
MATKEEILEVLKGVIDPEIGLNIVDLGLVYEVEFNENEISITMTLTTPGCPMHNSITAWAEKVITQLEPEASVKINLVWEPKWSPDLMSIDARRELGI